MGKAQFAQKVDPGLHERLGQLISQYTAEGRIKEKGEILDILYQDHIASEQKRQLKELMYAAEVEGLLGRIEELFLQSSKSFQTQIGLFTKRTEEEKQLLQNKIEELENIIQVQKQQLSEKTIALYEAGKQLEKCQNRMKGNKHK
ncbi:hypothetical protein PUS82_00550 [Cytobacillus firmus]|uniref:hypothetical protein n=1 Tax=Cytobacillus firmus TaxID=1399 RepID=UPI00237A924C|nr:hypothetical protein [Cytobacillus firmus]MDD9309821.1 hypothetical protein [Cytobacillus firmus]